MQDDRRDPRGWQPDLDAVDWDGVALLWLTLAGMVVLTLGAFFLQLDVGFFSFLIGALLCLMNPSITKGAVGEIAWPTILLVCGILWRIYEASFALVTLATILGLFGLGLGRFRAWLYGTARGRLPWHLPHLTHPTWCAEWLALYEPPPLAQSVPP